MCSFYRKGNKRSAAPSGGYRRIGVGESCLLQFIYISEHSSTIHRSTEDTLCVTSETAIQKAVQTVSILTAPDSHTHMHKTSIQANLHITISILNSKVEFYVCTSFAQTVTNVKPLRTVPCCLLYQSTLWRWEVEWQWDILKPFNNLLLLWFGVTRQT